MKRFFSFLKNLFYYLLALPFRLAYKSKYLKGRYFKFGQIGWKWVIIDGANKVFKGYNRGVPWPVSKDVHVVGPQNISFDNDDLHIFHTYGTYFQAIDAKIVIGKGTWIAPNVGLITTNHDIDCLDKHVKGGDITIGEKCWIGMNSVILPSVTLGKQTIVGAGAVVTKSFPDGCVVVGGVPAKIIKVLKKEYIND